MAATLPVLPDLVFEDFTLIQVPVTIGNNKYWLKECEGNDAIRYKGAMSAAIRIVDGKAAGMTEQSSYADMDLLGACLFRQKDGKPVPVAVFGKWPYKILKPLIEAAKTLSNLDTKETKEQLLKQKQKIEDKLKLLEVGGPTSDPKALPSDTANTSPSLIDSESSVSIVSSDELLIDSSLPGEGGSN